MSDEFLVGGEPKPVEAAPTTQTVPAFNPELQPPLAPAPATAEPGGTPVAETPVLLLYDYWDEWEVHHKAGSVINVSVDEAKRLIKIEKAERADPFPGEE